MRHFSFEVFCTSHPRLKAEGRNDDIWGKEGDKKMRDGSDSAILGKSSFAACPCAVNGMQDVPIHIQLGLIGTWHNCRSGSIINEWED